jgi:hypothetical protein
MYNSATIFALFDALWAERQDYGEEQYNEENAEEPPPLDNL